MTYVNFRDSVDFLRRRPDIVTISTDEPLAETVAAIALERLRAGVTDDPAALVPDYIRPSYAEEPPRPRASPKDTGPPRTAGGSWQ